LKSFFIPPKPLLAFSAFLLGAVLVSGCGGSIEQSRVKGYGQDGHLGLSNTNPRLPNTPHSQSYQQDADFAELKVKQVKGVKNARLAFDGPTLRVYVTPEAGLSAAKREQVRSRVESQLAFNMPRYKVIAHLAS
jgi:hypothetical protein